MNLEAKLQQLKRAAQKNSSELELERQLEYLLRLETRAVAVLPLPAERVPKGIEEYVDGRVEQNARGDFFVARQALPFGRPYGKLRIGDLSTTELHPLNLFLPGAALPEPSRLMFLDTETTGLAGGTGTCVGPFLSLAQGYHNAPARVHARRWTDMGFTPCPSREPILGQPNLWLGCSAGCTHVAGSTLR